MVILESPTPFPNPCGGRESSQDSVSRSSKFTFTIASALSHASRSCQCNLVSAPLGLVARSHCDLLKAAADCALWPAGLSTVLFPPRRIFSVSSGVEKASPQRSLRISALSVLMNSGAPRTRRSQFGCPRGVRPRAGVLLEEAGKHRVAGVSEAGADQRTDHHIAEVVQAQHDSGNRHAEGAEE